MVYFRLVHNEKEPLRTEAAQNLLRRHLAQRQERNASYSLRAFARSLKMEPSAISEIITGKRLVTQQMATRIANALMLAPEQRQSLLDEAIDRRLKKFRREPTRGPAQQSVNRLQLTQDQFMAVAEWYHFAILSLAETQDFQSDAKWIARRLGIQVSVAEAAIERLLRLEMLQSEDGNLKPTGLSYITTDEVRDLSLRRAHFQNLELARDSLEEDDISVRDFGAMTMAVDPDLLPEAKKRIRAFRRDLCAFLESGNKRAVYKMCLQLFPLSKEKVRHENE